MKTKAEKMERAAKINNARLAGLEMAKHVEGWPSEFAEIAVSSAMSIVKAAGKVVEVSISAVIK